MACYAGEEVNEVHFIKQVFHVKSQSTIKLNDCHPILMNKLIIENLSNKITQQQHNDL